MRSTQSSSFFLDFLYPPEAQALLKRWSARSYRWYRKHAKDWIRNHSRDFSSTLQRSQGVLATEEIDERAETPRTRASSDDSPPFDLTAEPVNDLERDTIETASKGRRKPLEWLLTLLRNPSGLHAQEVAPDIWMAYDSLSTSVNSVPLRKAIFRFLVRSPRQLDQRRLIELYDSFPENEKEEMLDVVVPMLSSLQEWSRAVTLHNSSLDANPQSPLSLTATESLFSSCFTHRQWNHGLVVLASRFSYHKRMDNYRQVYTPWFRSTLKRLQETPNFIGGALELLAQAVAQTVDISDAARDQAFMGIMTAFFRNGPSLEQHQTAIQRLETLSRARRSFYEKTILTHVTRQGKPQGTTAMLQQLYDWYRRTPHFKPYWKFLRIMVQEAIARQEDSLVMMLERDLLQHCAETPFEIGGILMNWHSRRGELDEVRNVLKECLKGSVPPSIWVFHPLLLAESRRHGPSQVRERLDWISKNFQLGPDLYSYNVLLQAQAQADDFEGGVKTMESIVRAGYSPDRYTVAAILNLAARRGDTKLARNYMRIALDQQMPIDISMYERIVLAHVNAGQFGQAVSLAERVTTTVPEHASNVWSHILAGMVFEKRPRKALFVGRRMRALEVPFDGYIYANLMRVFTLVKRPAMALSIMSYPMAADNIKPTALHYAILIDGYAKSGKFANAWNTYARMLKDGIRPTLSCRLALLKLEAMTARRQLASMRIVHPGVRLDVLEELLEEVTSEDLSPMIIDRDVQILLRGYRPTEAVPAVYFDAVLDAYGSIRSHEILLLLINKFQTMSGQYSSGQRARWSLRVVFRVMCMRLDQGDHSALDELWQTAFEIAQTLARRTGSSTGVIIPDQLSESEASEVSWTDLEGENIIPNKSKLLLNDHAKIFMRSLRRRGQLGAMAQLMKTVHSSGFILSSQIWNFYVRALISHRFIAEAFELTETRLMGHFRGWNFSDWIAGSSQPPPTSLPQNEREAFYVRSHLPPGTNVSVAEGLKERGMEYMGGLYEPLKPGDLHVEYVTLVRLRQSLRSLGERTLGTSEGQAAHRRDASKRELRAQIRATAPDTVRAIQYLPGLHVGKARQVLRGTVYSRKTRLSWAQAGRRRTNRRRNRQQKLKRRILEREKERLGWEKTRKEEENSLRRQISGRELVDLFSPASEGVYESAEGFEEVHGADGESDVQGAKLVQGIADVHEGEQRRELEVPELVGVRNDT